MNTNDQIFDFLEDLVDFANEFGITAEDLLGSTTDNPINHLYSKLNSESQSKADEYIQTLPNDQKGDN